MTIAGNEIGVVPLAVAALILSAAATRVVLVYARKRLLDLPGRRRSHSAPTPRGGGLGFVIVLATYALLASPFPFAARIEATLAIALVAAVGFWDDHRPLGALPKIIVQLVAAGFALVALAPPGAGFSSAALIVIAVLAVALVWSINLHNFMDGIDGLLAWQAQFVFVATAISSSTRSEVDATTLAVVSAASVLGFLPFNFPRARIFMGDVGSGVLGLWIGVVLLLAIRNGALALPVAFLLVSAFAIDAGMTLAARFARGRRWYSAHREHLYQWLVRGERSHAFVVGLYMGWNLIVVAPLSVWLSHDVAAPAWPVVAVVYAAGAILWIFGKRAAVARARSRRHSHAAA